jgi:hypothetical protein
MDDNIVDSNPDSNLDLELDLSDKSKISDVPVPIPLPLPDGEESTGQSRREGKRRIVPPSRLTYELNSSSKSKKTKKSTPVSKTNPTPFSKTQKRSHDEISSDSNKTQKTTQKTNKINIVSEFLDFSFTPKNVEIGNYKLTESNQKIIDYVIGELELIREYTKDDKDKKRKLRTLFLQQCSKDKFLRELFEKLIKYLNGKSDNNKKRIREEESSSFCIKIAGGNMFYIYALIIYYYLIKDQEIIIFIQEKLELKLEIEINDEQKIELEESIELILKNDLSDLDFTLLINSQSDEGYKSAEVDKVDESDESDESDDSEYEDNSNKRMRIVKQSGGVDERLLNNSIKVSSPGFFVCRLKTFHSIDINNLKRKIEEYTGKEKNIYNTKLLELISNLYAEIEKKISLLSHKNIFLSKKCKELLNIDYRKIIFPQIFQSNMLSKIENIEEKYHEQETDIKILKFLKCQKKIIEISKDINIQIFLSFLDSKIYSCYVKTDKDINVLSSNFLIKLINFFNRKIKSINSILIKQQYDNELDKKHLHTTDVICKYKFIQTAFSKIIENIFIQAEYKDLLYHMQRKLNELYNTSENITIKLVKPPIVNHTFKDCQEKFYKIAESFARPPNGNNMQLSFNIIHIDDALPLLYAYYYDIENQKEFEQNEEDESFRKLFQELSINDDRKHGGKYTKKTKIIKKTKKIKKMKKIKKTKKIKNRKHKKQNKKRIN